MDLADASLVWLAEHLELDQALTLDEGDFGVYRTERGQRLANLLA